MPENIRQRLDPQAVDPILKQVALQHLNYLEGTYYEKYEFKDFLPIPSISSIFH